MRLCIFSLSRNVVAENSIILHDAYVTHDNKAKNKKK